MSGLPKKGSPKMMKKAVKAKGPPFKPKTANGPKIMPKKMAVPKTKTWPPRKTPAEPEEPEEPDQEPIRTDPVIRTPTLPPSKPADNSTSSPATPTPSANLSAKKPPLTKGIALAKQPAETQQPAEAAETEQTTGLEEPAGIEQPAEEPAGIEEPAEAEEPAGNEEPELAEEPAGIEEPALAEKLDTPESTGPSQDPENLKESTPPGNTAGVEEVALKPEAAADGGAVQEQPPPPKAPLRMWPPTKYPDKSTGNESSTDRSAKESVIAHTEGSPTAPIAKVPVTMPSPPTVAEEETPTPIQSTPPLETASLDGDQAPAIEVFPSQPLVEPAETEPTDSALCVVVSSTAAVATASAEADRGVGEDLLLSPTAESAKLSETREWDEVEDMVPEEGTPEAASGAEELAMDSVGPKVCEPVSTIEAPSDAESTGHVEGSSKAAGRPLSNVKVAGEGGDESPAAETSPQENLELLQAANERPSSSATPASTLAQAAQPRAHMESGVSRRQPVSSASQSASRGHPPSNMSQRQSTSSGSRLVPESLVSQEPTSDAAAWQRSVADPEPEPGTKGPLDNVRPDSRVLMGSIVEPGSKFDSVSRVQSEARAEPGSRVQSGLHESRVESGSRLRSGPRLESGSRVESGSRLESGSRVVDPGSRVQSGSRVESGSRLESVSRMESESRVQSGSRVQLGSLQHSEVSEEHGRELHSRGDSSGQMESSSRSQAVGLGDSGTEELYLQMDRHRASHADSETLDKPQKEVDDTETKSLSTEGMPSPVVEAHRRDSSSEMDLRAAQIEGDSDDGLAEERVETIIGTAAASWRGSRPAESKIDPSSSDEAQEDAPQMQSISSADEERPENRSKSDFLDSTVAQLLQSAPQGPERRVPPAARPGSQSSSQRRRGHVRNTPDSGGAWERTCSSKDRSSTLNWSNDQDTQGYRTKSSSSTSFLDAPDGKTRGFSGAHRATSSSSSRRVTDVAWQPYDEEDEAYQKEEALHAAISSDEEQWDVTPPVVHPEASLTVMSLSQTGTPKTFSMTATSSSGVKGGEVRSDEPCSDEAEFRQPSSARNDDLLSDDRYSTPDGNAGDEDAMSHDSPRRGADEEGLVGLQVIEALEKGSQRLAVENAKRQDAGKTTSPRVLPEPCVAVVIGLTSAEAFDPYTIAMSSGKRLNGTRLRSLTGMKPNYVPVSSRSVSLSRLRTVKRHHTAGDAKAYRTYSDAQTPSTSVRSPALGGIGTWTGTTIWPQSRPRATPTPSKRRVAVVETIPKVAQPPKMKEPNMEMQTYITGDARPIATSTAYTLRGTPVCVVI